jgi:hypothetical protein
MPPSIPAPPESDDLLDDSPPIDHLDEAYFLEEVARIMADARRRAAGGDPPPSFSGASVG